MNSSSSDSEKGLYDKFRVERTDGSSRSGEKHEKCIYFVLDIDHDQFAAPALRAYAEACKLEFPLLARDLIEIAKNITRHGRVLASGLRAYERTHPAGPFD